MNLAKTRKRMIGYMIAGFAIMVTFLVTLINVVSFSIVSEDADTFIRNIASESGFHKSSIAPVEVTDRDYFYVVFYNDSSKENLVYSSNTDRFNVTTVTEMSDTVKDEINGWWGLYLRHGAKNNSEGDKMVIFADYEREVFPCWRTFWISLSLGLFVIGLSIPIIFQFTKSFLQPIAENSNRERHFVTNASHELKTPLAIIMANDELIELQYKETEETQTIKKQVTRMNGMVQDLVLLTKLEELKDIESKNFNISDTAKEVAMSFEPAFESKGYIFSSDIEDELFFDGNEDLIKRLMSIILENALKYTRSECSFSLENEEGKIVVVGKNDSDGLKDENMDRIFERFYRTANARGTTIEGSGVGLSIAKEIVDLHKAEITAYAKDGYFYIKATF